MQEDIHNLLKLNIQKMDILIELMYQNNYLLKFYIEKNFGEQSNSGNTCN